MSTAQSKSIYSPDIFHSEDISGPDSRNGAHEDGAYAEHGAPIDHKIPQEDVVQAAPELAWSKVRNLMREGFSEFLGTFILVMFGDGSVAQVVLSNGEKGDWTSINWGWAIGVMLGIYTAGVSGAHLNPAVTLANCIFRKHSWRKLPIYWTAQFLGAMCASAVVYANYKSAIDIFEGSASLRSVPGYSPTATAGIFCTYPAEHLTKTGQFFDEFIASALLMFLIYALLDDGNIGAQNLVPLALFFVVFGIGACFGWQTGYAINPARDLGPRLMSYMLGYGQNVWKAGNYYFWVPVVAPLCGCVFGGWLYDVFVFTGTSPINSEYMGFGKVLRHTRAKQASTCVDRV